MAIGTISFSNVNNSDIDDPNSSKDVISLDDEFGGLTSKYAFSTRPSIRYLYTLGYTDNLIYTYGEFMWNNYKFRYNGYEKKKVGFYMDDEEEDYYNGLYQDDYCSYIFCYKNTCHIYKWPNIMGKDSSSISISNVESNSVVYEETVSLGVSKSIFSAHVDKIIGGEDSNSLSSTISIDFHNYDEDNPYKAAVLDITINQYLYMIYIYEMCEEDSGYRYNAYYYYTRSIESICAGLER